MRTLTLVVAAVIRNASGRILLARRKPGVAFGGYWEFPGGKVEWGEPPRAALHREVREELNLDIRIGPLLEVLSYTRQSIHWVVLFFDCCLTQPQGPVELDTDSEIQWADPRDLDHIEILPPNRSVLNVIVPGKP